MKSIHLVCAARPNFMKIAPLWHVLAKERWCTSVIVHTGQHYDENMSDNFFRDLNLPKPAIALGVGSGTHAQQTGRTMIEYENACGSTSPDLTLVVGDVNATVACALVCAKLGIPVAHLEAGLRSFDRTMPEEINRIVTDSISSLCLTPSADASENLLREGVPSARIKLVGNIMIDSVEMLRGVFESTEIADVAGVASKHFGIVTLHRPSNVDSKEKLSALVSSLGEVSSISPLIFPLHPRTRKQLIDFGLLRELEENKNIFLAQPLGYKKFMALLLRSKFVITDSGGVQEETSYLGIPCFTLRENTERPITVTLGTNKLVSTGMLVQEVAAVMRQGRRVPPTIPLWDGLTAGRVATELQSFLNV